MPVRTKSSRRPRPAALRRALLAWYRREARDLPWRRTREPYAIWVSEVMLQQTTVEAVLPYYARFLARYPDIGALAAASEDELLALWSGLGYYRRARNMRAAARLIVERHAGRFPETIEEIRALPGVGRYTAGAIASIAFGARAAVVDGNVARVLSRLFALEPRSSDAELWRIAEELVPAKGASEWNQALMELGARVCRHARPVCDRCPVSSECLAFASGDPTRYSPSKRRPPAVDARASLVAIARRGRILLVRRPENELLGGLWELPGTLALALRKTAAPSPSTTVREPSPSADLADLADLRLQLRSELGFEPVHLEPRGSIVHTVTHRRLTIGAWRARAPGRLPAALAKIRGERHLWVSPTDLETVPLGAATKKTLQLLRRGVAGPGGRGSIGQGRC